MRSVYFECLFGIKYKIIIRENQEINAITADWNSFDYIVAGGGLISTTTTILLRKISASVGKLLRLSSISIYKRERERKKTIWASTPWSTKLTTISWLLRIVMKHHPDDFATVKLCHKRRYILFLSLSLPCGISLWEHAYYFSQLSISRIYFAVGEDTTEPRWSITILIILRCCCCWLKVGDYL